MPFPYYHYNDYLKMAEYYKQCGNINKTRILYQKKYGKCPSYSIVRRALATVEKFGASEKCKNNNSTDSTGASENHVTMLIKEEITDEITIKEEKEDDEINVKEEIGDIFLEDSVMDDNISIKKVDSDLNRCPLVYTTRLDDMEVFKKDFNSMSVQTIVDNIVWESKPQLRKLSQSELRIGRHIKKDSDVTSFNNILDKVEEYNHITTYVDFGADLCEIEDLFLIEEENRSKLCLSDRSKELLKLCKPLSITLTDINGSNEFPIFITEILESTHLHIDKLLLRYSFFMVEDRYLNSTDIYFCYDKFVPTYLYHLNCIVSKNSDLPLYKYLQNRYNLSGRKVYKVANCCWHKRENNIEFIAKTLFGCESTSLMKKPHLCPLSKCVCCCKSDASHDSKLVKTKNQVNTAKGESVSCVKNPMNECADWLIRSLELKMKKTNLDLDPWFDQAIRNIVKSTKNYSRNALSDTLPWSFAIAQGKNIRHMASDRFELGQGQNINLYIHSPPAQKKVPKDVNVAACCWRKKKSIISGLGFAAHVKNFMKMPHTCHADKCFCCCSDAHTSKGRTILPLKDIMLPKQTFYTINYSSQFVPTGKSYVNEVDFTHTPNILKNTIVTKPPNSVKTGPTTQTGLTVPLVPPRGFDISDLSQDPTVNTLINSILERFKDIRLSINAEGKVFAELNTAIDNLSTEELKVLSNILARVQEQANSLGLAGNPYIIHSLTTSPTMAVNNKNHKDAKTQNNQDTTKNFIKETNSTTHPLEKVNNIFLPISKSDNSNSENRNCALDYLILNTPNDTDSDNSKTNAPTNLQIMKPQERQNLYQNLDIELNACSHQYISYKTLMKWKYQQYKDSFRSFIAGRNKEGTPIIENVFSLSAVNETTKNNDLSTGDNEFMEPKPGPSGVSSKVNHIQRRKPGPSRELSGVKRTYSNKAKQSNKKLKIKSLQELLSERPRVPQVTPPLAANGSSQLLHHELQAPPMLGGNVITPFIVNNQFASDLPVQSHNDFIDQEMHRPPFLSGNIITPIIPPLIINNHLGFDPTGQSHKNFVNMSSQLPALMPFNNPVIITNTVNLDIPTPEKTDDECILGV